MSAAERNLDRGETLWELTQLRLVACPRCNRCATAEVLGRGTGSHQRLTCPECSHTTRANAGDVGFVRPGFDTYFDVPLWLQTPCCGNLLWAYNPAHLQRIEARVGARLRERHRHAQTGWANRSFASRLPPWMLSRKNRQAVLKAVAKLRAKALFV